MTIRSVRMTIRSIIRWLDPDPKIVVICMIIGALVGIALRQLHDTAWEAPAPVYLLGPLPSSDADGASK
jgi:hypothetical protein